MYVFSHCSLSVAYERSRSPSCLSVCNSLPLPWSAGSDIWWLPWEQPVQSENYLLAVDKDVEECHVFWEVLTDQLQRQVSDGLISTPQLLSELLHLLQESLNLNTCKHTSGLQFIRLFPSVFFSLKEEGNS